MSPRRDEADHEPRVWYPASLRRAIGVALAVLFLDQLTKRWALDRLGEAPCSVEGSCIDVFWTLRFNLSFNPGAAFSSFTGGGPVLGLIAIGMAFYLSFLAAQSTDRWLPLLFGGVIGGAVGNLWDRITRADDGPLSGTVVDFIDFQWWPIFNVADIFVVGGVIALVARFWWVERSTGANSEVEAA